MIVSLLRLDCAVFLDILFEADASHETLVWIIVNLFNKYLLYKC